MNKKQREKFARSLIGAGVSDKGVGKIMGLLEEALTPEPKKPRVKKPSTMVTLMQWEETQGKRLDVRHMLAWVDKHGYDIPAMVTLVEEFRIDMLSKGKEYVDFRLAFQNYFNKGWLSLKPDSPKVKRANQTGTNFDRRGGSL